MANRASNPNAPGTRPGFPGAIIVVALVVLVLIVFWIFKQPRIAANPNGPRHQISKDVEFNDLAVTSVGGKFDIEGQATDRGDKPITRLTVEVGYKNLTGSTLEAPAAEVTNADGTDLHSKPLLPNQSSPILIKMAHAPQGWDGKPPQLNVTSVEWEQAQGSAAGGASRPTGGAR